MTEDHLYDAIAMSEDERLTRTVVELGDEKTKGLTIRITPHKPIWYIRRREKTLRLKDIRELSLEDARYVADQIALAAKRNRDLNDLVHILLEYAPRPSDGSTFRDRDVETRLDHMLACRDEAKGISPPPFWTWKQLTDEFLQRKQRRLKASYRRKYERYLRLEQFASINNKMVRDIKLSDLERVRDEIDANYAPSTVDRALSQSKEMLTWAWKNKATASGLDTLYKWWDRWSYECTPKKRPPRTPTIEEIARTLIIAERCRHLADGEHDTNPGTIGALWGVALTGQRSGALTKLRTDRLFPADKEYRKLKAWMIANWTFEEMKGGRDGGRPHSLPIPPEALKVMNRYHKEACGDSPWMFPARNPDQHVSRSALDQLIYRLQGKVYDHTVRQKPHRKGKPGPQPRPLKVRLNLFERFGVRHWTPQDCRRTITTFLVDRRLEGAASAILGHKQPKSDANRDANREERERLARVTEQHYNSSQRIRLKADGMAPWVKALLSAYNREQRRLQTTLQHRAAA
ncbi:MULTISPECIES: tyrosine-type recombinase/integrase [Bradyrhizobium]|uniref:tyrosine-type recombinase/integrase n=1 Tax=Bradyrhizobium TaxID=374 RepID=UPI001E3EED92|nr:MULTISPECIES: hypothetical protein [Bradyrhizobium]UFW46259.1 hypothetical protein BaraCB756_28570 [Bradyrhizobium arachidis]